MEEPSNCAPSLPKEPVVLDVKPLRSLAPMFPAPLGLSTFSPPEAPSFVCVTPFGSFATAAKSVYPSSFTPLFPTFAAAQDINKRPVDPASLNSENGAAHIGEGFDANSSIHDTPCSRPFQTPPVFVMPLNEEDSLVNCATSASGRTIKRNSYLVGSSEIESTDGKKVKRRRARRVQGNDLLALPSSSDEPRESVEVVLMTFDAIRRRLQQLDEIKDVKQRSDLRAGTVMMDNDLRANMIKRIGQVPGVEVGDIFYFRIEMCLVGLHSQSIAGIDYMTTRFGNEDDPVALSIVSAGVYENEDNNADVLIYSGQGSSSKDDQKLERGNLALERSLHRANEIRVIRSAKDFSCLNGKIYVYDGLYKIHESWVEKRKSGFNVFKYKLLREPGQPDGTAVWKKTEKWKENPSSRHNVILPDISSGIEKKPVCLVNDVDDEKGPSHFTYTTKVDYLGPISSMQPLQGCNCNNVCLPSDVNCSCLQQNGADLPYSSIGILVSRKPLIYECGASCQCSFNCRNRVTQKGIQLHFEVFKTRDGGWGLRSWDPIRAGTFICEYVGEVIDKCKVAETCEEDEYVFQVMHADQTFKWNYGPELLGEPSHLDSSESSKTLPIIISAKNMGNVSRFMNHSCSPNVFWQPVLHDHGDDQYPHIMFFASKHIPPMTELTYDYGLSGRDFSKDEEMRSGGGYRRTKKCLCGSSKCTGFFG
ncbi:LOW QUALITY PROTEIN: histone-lysine N-methyltransferase, H3 lysine-9 specific SUVH1-like [Phoenix dactylifera]|uniref:LOW QUALITY PROTEIN: histone-lysine N-methyltransferase, H3 lysine-9 specific SUVH1-like n=1 Tax=Phoenix dactylifera TaxID=42345 RepID=A0A8B7D0K6_PHODC|nr:LOW QUALITY PROTEIN: histone-lysine N-methyltransferase, H3 lysine-9 specific SUVH1-like [Phoenix dactylifera]